MSRTKYIRTKDDKIIVFSETFNHSDFKHKQPVSAGFISFGVNSEGNASCTCYGESISLGMESDEKDTKLAMRQILGHPYWD
jgi:hypothetical protein